ncbi:DUF2298 domain-containing protein [Natronorarus salvus]|uniref:DUF2298 domain-containing protein n=1 Tax=Natronorarus salvus TaxID=3117733 RepID=UPI002F26DE96
MEYGLVALWWLFFLSLAASGAPAAAALLARCADRGLSLSLPLSFSVLALVGFWAGQVRFGLLAFGVGLLTLLAASLLALRRGVRLPHRSVVLDTLVVFTLAYLLVIVIRGLDPAVTPTAGEKFLDFGLLQTLLRAEVLPPEDVWFAGEPVRYYYGGHMLAALFAEATGTDARFAYNLALAGFYATSVTAAFGLAGTVAAGMGYPRRTAGALAAFLFGVAGTLTTALGLLLWVLPDTLAEPLLAATGYEPDRVSGGPTQFSYWDASRVIEGTINEFPLFAYLNGDLHAHMMSVPFVLLVAACCHEYYRTPEEERRRRLALLASGGVLVGLLAFVNTWDAPIATGLLALTLALAHSGPTSLLPERFRRGSPSSVRIELRRLVLAGLLVVPPVLLGLLAVVPFLTGTASGRSVGFLPDRSPLGSLLLVHGTFLVAFWAFFLTREEYRGHRRTIVALALFALVLGWLADLAAVGLALPLLALGWHRCRTGGGFASLLVVAGSGLVLIVEVAYVVETAGPERLNTVFKTYAQLWGLWSVAGGVVLAGLLSDRRRFAPSTPPRTRRNTATLLVVLVVAASGLYAPFALASHAATSDEKTLDATAFVEEQHPEEAEAIAWLAEREGQPTMVSAPGTHEAGIYRWVNAPSSLTGVPTVAGWAHQTGYRDPGEYHERVADVGTIYEGEPDERRALLTEYDVEYVYVGPEERERYELGEFEELPGVEVAGEFGAVVIYRVD